jgi:hypothetical protein
VIRGEALRNDVEKVYLYELLDSALHLERLYHKASKVYPLLFQNNAPRKA